MLRPERTDHRIISAHAIDRDRRKHGRFVSAWGLHPDGWSRDTDSAGNVFRVDSYISTAPCAGGMAQRFHRARNRHWRSDAAHPDGQFLESTGPVIFTGSGSVVMGPLGSLTLTNPGPTSLVIQGGARLWHYDCHRNHGSLRAVPASSDELDAYRYGERCAVWDSRFRPSRNLTLTITQISTGAAPATGALDVSPVLDSIFSLRQATTAIITNWTLSDSGTDRLEPTSR